MLSSNWPLIFPIWRKKNSVTYLPLQNCMYSTQLSFTEHSITRMVFSFFCRHTLLHQNYLHLFWLYVVYFYLYFVCRELLSQLHIHWSGSSNFCTILTRFHTGFDFFFHNFFIISTFDEGKTRTYCIWTLLQHFFVRDNSLNKHPRCLNEKAT